MNCSRCFLTIGLVFFISVSFSQKLYFSESGAGSISRTNGDGSTLEKISQSALTGIKDLAIDEATNTIYFIDNVASFAIVRRAPISSFGGVVKLGVSEEFIRVAAPANRFEALSIDPVNRNLFITNLAAGSIIKVSLDALPTIIDVSSYTLYTGLFATYGIDVDPVNARFYYVNQATTRQIQMASTSGGLSTVIVNVSGTYGQIHDVAVDPIGGSLYFTTVIAGQGNIYKANLDGSNPLPIVTGRTSAIKGITLDHKNGFLYWADDANVGRANLDGTGASSIVTGRNVAEYVTIDFSSSVPPKLYWAEGDAEELHRINTNGSDFERYYSSVGEGPAYHPTGMAVDVYSRYIYWTDQDLGTVRRGRIGETAFESLETLLDFSDYTGGTLGIALDPANGMMYLANGTTGSIQRADYNAPTPSTTLTTIATIANPFGVDLDLVNGKIYFTANNLVAPNTGTLYRANLDGTGIETLSVDASSGVSPERFMHDVKVDPINGKVYWVFTEADGEGTIFHADIANVSGTKAPLIAKAPGEVRGIEIDPPTNTIWWVNRGISSLVAPSIMEANLTNGTNVKDLHAITLSTAGSNFIVLDKGCEAPLAADISITAPIGQTTNADPLASASINPGDIITMTITPSPAKGTASVQSNNTIHYTPNSGTIGADVITYQICNQCGLCDQGTITIDIPNVAPVIASPGSAQATSGNSIFIPFINLVSDANNNLDLSTLAVITSPASGAIAHFNNNSELVINYTNVSFSGTDNLTVQVCDQAGACTTLPISITVALPSSIVIYNALSPNGDIYNPYFKIENIEIVSPQNKVSIYNRWGDQVFEVSNYINTDAAQRFNGESNQGKDLPTGIYFYRIEFSDGRPELTGYLTLKR